MHADVLKAFQIVDCRSTDKDVLVACRDLFVQSDQFTHAGDIAFEPSEIDAVAHAIYSYIRDPDNVTKREIQFDVPRSPVGISVEYCEYASRFSADLLFQNYSRQFNTPNLADLRRRLMSFLAAILFRYQFCVAEDRAAFPVSVVLDYIDAVGILLKQENRAIERSKALVVTMIALRSLEPRFRAMESRSPSCSKSTWKENDAQNQSCDDFGEEGSSA